MKEKNIISLSAEHLYFLVTSVGWLVTNIYNEFVTMNQNARQKVKTPIKRDFYKLMNNANFGIGCRNNIDNCKFEPIYGKIDDISFI